MSISVSSLLDAAQKVNRDLLQARTAQGHWEGELSSSALSTATAVCALAVAGAGGRDETLMEGGLRWLAEHQNADGGWGDTVRSLGNVSTTALVWAAFGAVAGLPSVKLVAKESGCHKYDRIVRAAERRLAGFCGQNSASADLRLDDLIRTIIARYGKDRTFSVPILTMCALSGRLGTQAEAWESVIPLPYELAAFPRQWFAALRLPVVSYALPALIAIGQARFFHRPPRNPLLRLIRRQAIRPTLRVLEEIQPTSGGFLEATPLTSFVTMSLAASGQRAHPVTVRALEFLRQSARVDGSWPIDTNLATWVTTLSINALCSTHCAQLDGEDRKTLQQWLLRQQYRTTHPYTRAAPGGWAWTNLPGGVPDADDTAGALIALAHLDREDTETRGAALLGVQWLLDLQNSDGGIPTFCRGWGALPFDRSAPDLTAHALRAWMSWFDLLPPATQSSVRAATIKAVDYLRRTQGRGGEWVPLWFGNQFHPEDLNPLYGTAKSLLGLAAVGGLAKVEPVCARAVHWLLSAQLPSGGWGGFPGGPESVEETALALEALAAAQSVVKTPEIAPALQRGLERLAQRVNEGALESPSPIGFYFAKLWYYERLYPLIFAAAAFNRALQPLSSGNSPSSRTAATSPVP